MVMTTSAARTTSSVQGWVLACDVDAAFGHCRDGGRVDFGAGFGAAGPGDRGVGGEVGEEAEGDLGAAGVTGAQKRTIGRASVERPSTPARARRRGRANRSAISGRKLGMLLAVANRS
jgi:hypothetical protein